MISNEDLKDLLPMLLSNTDSLEKSVIGSFSNLCERKNIEYVLYFVNADKKIDIFTAGIDKDAILIGDNEYQEYINALLPSIADILSIYSENEEDKKAFYDFFNNLLLESFEEKEVHTLMYDNQRKIFNTSDGQGWRKEKVTNFVNIARLLEKMAQ